MPALLVGRFQPPHRGHVFAIREAARRHGSVYVAVGSAQHSHSADDPFTIGERFEMLTAALAAHDLRQVFLFPLPDLHRHGDWVRHVERLLPPFDVVVTNNPLPKRLFTSAGYRVDEGPLWRREACSGRAIRAAWRRGEEADDLLPPPVARVLTRIDGPARARRFAEA